MAKVSNCPVCGLKPQVVKARMLNAVLCYGPQNEPHPRVGTGGFKSPHRAKHSWEAIVKDVLASNPSNPVNPVKEAEVANG